MFLVCVIVIIYDMGNMSIEILSRFVWRELSHYLQANSQMSSIQTSMIIRKGSILHVIHNGLRLLGFPDMNIIKKQF